MRKALTTALAALLLAGGCSPGPAEDRDTLRILAGSELADLAPILREAREETGVSVALNGGSDLDPAGIEKISGGSSPPSCSPPAPPGGCRTPSSATAPRSTGW